MYGEVEQFLFLFSILGRLDEVFLGRLEPSHFFARKSERGDMHYGRKYWQMQFILFSPMEKERKAIMKEKSFWRKT